MNRLPGLLTALVLVGSATCAQAGEFAELRTKLTAARESLVTLLLHADKRGPEQQKLVKDTANAVSAQLAKMKAPAGKAAEFKDLVETWNAFKKTRETVLVPAILKGNMEEANKVAGGIQKERYTKCQRLAIELDS